ncbi:MAG: glycosyltransferase family 4 protein [Acidimicrobiia bacterium]|nr:glycosyltransferase family 4 protein [Acidimicrobiia bacterium]
MTRLRILEVASELPPVRSGVARAAGRVVEGLRVRGHHVDCLSSVDAWRFSVGEFRFSALGARWLRLQRLVQGYDLVHLTGPAPFIADALLLRWRIARGDRPPLVYTHGFDLVLEGLRRPSHVYRRAVRSLMNTADAVVVTTPGYQARYASLRVAPVVIPWASELEVVARSTPPFDGSGPLRVLFVGQHRPYKGVDRLIDAAAGLDDVHLTMIGGGSGAPGDTARIAELGATNITHLGRVGDDVLEQQFADHDVICLPSTNESEAFGIVLLEGMASGCAAVASDLPGVRDVVGDAGLLVPPRDTGALRAALARLAADPGLVASLAAAGHTSAARYSWEATTDAYERLYLDLVSSS